MSDARTRFYFDFVDPGSYLMDLRLERLTAGSDRTVERVPLEVRPPPQPLLDADDPVWTEYWRQVADSLAYEGVRVARPRLVPWTRKAHEMVLHAQEQGDGAPARMAVFVRFHEAGDDIGRVDVLLDVAVALGLDRTAVKAVLDVDRHAATVEKVRAAAGSLGVRGVPTLALGERLLEGIHDDDTIGAFLSAGTG
jgi:predicted DsbA family dithiol-disulfide isomerase